MCAENRPGAQAWRVFVRAHIHRQTLLTACGAVLADVAPRQVSHHHRCNIKKLRALITLSLSHSPLFFLRRVVTRQVIGLGLLIWTSRADGVGLFAPFSGPDPPIRYIWLGLLLCAARGIMTMIKCAAEARRAAAMESAALAWVIIYRVSGLYN